MLIVHDFAYQHGGAERVTAALAEAFPAAEVLVIGGRRSVLVRMGVEDRARVLLGMGRLPDGYRALSPVLPAMLRRQGADVVLSSSYAFAHHVRARETHVEYCHSPLRQIWVKSREYERALGGAMATGLRAFGPFLRRSDLRAVAEVDQIVASCANVSDRIREIYGRRAQIVYPPVTTDSFFPTSAERERGLALLAARLVEPYKAVTETLETFRTLPYRLVVAGDGRDSTKIRASAPANVTFLGELGDDELREWYSRAEVVVFPGEDDFGLVPLEAMCCGTPVVALDAGGARETVVQGVTGIRFRTGGLAQAVQEAMEREWARDRITAHAAAFSKDAFIDAIRVIVAETRARTEP